MAQIAKIDHISMLSCEEEFGVVMSMTRIARVSGIDVSAVTQEAQNGYRALNEALNDVGIPQYGEPLDDEENINLILTKRSAKVIDRDRVEIELVYSHFLGEGQYLISSDQTSMAQVYGETSANLNQTESAYETPENEDRISVEYNGVTQYGTINVLIPQETYTVRGIIDESISRLREKMLGIVNSQPWRGRDERTWLCTAINGNVISTDPLRSKVTIEFQYNSETWDPLVTYIDENTGRSPSDLVEGTGYKRIQYYAGDDFGDILKASFEDE
jgi:hypothetical protein